MTSSARTPLVLIPGLACTRDLFADQVPELSKNCQIIHADHTGFDTMVQIAASVLSSAPERFALAGLSMGGYISLEIMRQAPERVERLCLMDTSARADTVEKTELRRDALELVAKGKYQAVCNSTLNLSIAESRHTDAVLKAAITKMAMDIGPDVWARQTRAIMGRENSVPLLGGIQCPTMVIVGDEDNLTPLDHATEMADLIPNSVLKIVTDCGHMSSMERPTSVLALLKNWLAM